MQKFLALKYLFLLRFNLKVSFKLYASFTNAHNDSSFSFFSKSKLSKYSNRLNRNSKYFSLYSFFELLLFIPIQFTFIKNLIIQYKEEFKGLLTP